MQQVWTSLSIDGRTHLGTLLRQTPYFPELETPAEVGHRAMDCAGHVAR